MHELAIDELNVAKEKEELEAANNAVNGEHKAIPYEEYFGEMGITKDQKEKRIAFAEQLEEKVTMVFALAAVMKKYNAINQSHLVETLIAGYIDVLGPYCTIDDRMDEAINYFAWQCTDTTLQNIEKEYFLSQKRAMFIAEDQANTAFNYIEYVQAIVSGKKYKTWHTIGDAKVRKHHKPLNGKRIKIADTFLVGDSVMSFPKDGSLNANPAEIINCRCWVTYS